MARTAIAFANKEVDWCNISYTKFRPALEAFVGNRSVLVAFVYVLKGSVVMQLKGANPVTLKAGETFYEDSTGVHIVGRNANDSRPAKLVVFLPESHSN